MSKPRHDHEEKQRFMIENETYIFVILIHRILGGLRKPVVPLVHDGLQWKRWEQRRRLACFVSCSGALALEQLGRLQAQREELVTVELVASLLARFRVVLVAQPVAGGVPLLVIVVSHLILRFLQSHR